MKRFISLMLALLMALSLVGCVSDTADGEIDASSGVSADTGKKSEKSEKLTIEEQVCFEHDGIRVTTTEITKDSIWGTGIKLLVENDSSKDYSVSADEVIVNGCMMSSLFSCEVAAGKKANDTLYLSSSDLEKAEIDSIKQIEIYFYVYDSSTYETVYKADCALIKTSLFDTAEFAPNVGGTEIYNENGIKINCLGIKEDAIWGTSIQLCIENGTDRNVTVSCDDLSVGGFMVTALFASTVYAGKYAIDDITLLSSSLEENGITSVDNVELAFRIYDSDTLGTIDETDVISINAN